MDNKRARDVLSSGIICFIIIDVIMLYFSIILPKFEYLGYKYNTEKYLIVDADVLESSEITLLPGKFAPLVSYRKNILKYTIDNVDYTQKTYSYPEVKEKSQIKIAVKIDNNTNIKRCIEYHLEEKQKIHLYIEIIVLVLFIILFLLNNYFMHKKEKKMRYNEKDFDEQILEKQLYILEHIRQSGGTEEELQKRLEFYNSKGIQFNSGTLWVLRKYGNAEEMKAIFNMLPLFNQNQYFDFLMEMYEQGLPENYYVLVKCDRSYYCSCKENEQLYMFSKGAGITHTKYTTIYDYIIEQINKG